MEFNWKNEGYKEEHDLNKNDDHGTGEAFKFTEAEPTFLTVTGSKATDHTPEVYRNVDGEGAYGSSAGGSKFDIGSITAKNVIRGNGLRVETTTGAGNGDALIEGMGGQWAEGDDEIIEGMGGTWVGDGADPAFGDGNNIVGKNITFGAHGLTVDGAQIPHDKQ